MSSTHSQTRQSASESQFTLQRAAADMTQEDQNKSNPGELAARLHSSPQAIAQRALNAQIQHSPYMTAQRAVVAGIAAAQHVEGSLAQSTLQRMAEGEEGKEVPASQEEDIENPGQEEPVEVDQSADQGASLSPQDAEDDALDDEDEESAELEQDDSEMAEGDEEESELPATDVTVTQPKVMQLVRGPRQSNRIASYRQNNARRDRRRRGARNRPVIRFVPGARVRTFLVGGIAALGGGTGLRCPAGSYVNRVNNFNYTGSRAGDIAALGGTPRGYVWHHHHDFVSTGPNAGHGTMMLLRIIDHLPGHRGGVYQWNHTPAHGAYG